MGGTKRIPLAEAQAIAEKYLKIIAPYTERIEIAGSIRRQKETIGDIEICCIPRRLPVLIPGIGLDDLATNSPDLLAKLGQKVKGGDRYKQYITPEGINLDLFIVLPPAEWGLIFMIRTGPWDFNKHLFTKRRFGGLMPSDMRVIDGALYRGDVRIPTPEESDVWEALGIDAIPPQERTAES